MVGRSRGWRDTQDGKLLLLLAAKMYLISVSGWLASWVLVCYFTCTPKMRRLKLCIYLNSTLVSNCHCGWFVQLLGVLRHRNIYYGAVYARDIEIVQMFGTFVGDLHWCISCYASFCFVFCFVLISWFIFVNVFRFCCCCWHYSEQALPSPMLYCTQGKLYYRGCLSIPFNNS